MRRFPLRLDTAGAGLAVSYRKGKRLSALERQFIQIAKDFFEDSVIQANA
ncbi:MAG: hypothetical protein HFF18_12775 [Oscillospiraceae bacterium]|nr:hypothetical protein [Oscillospiraceae bacterium]